MLLPKRPSNGALMACGFALVTGQIRGDEELCEPSVLAVSRDGSIAGRASELSTLDRTNADLSAERTRAPVIVANTSREKGCT